MLYTGLRVAVQLPLTSWHCSPIGGTAGEISNPYDCLIFLTKTWFLLHDNVYIPLRLDAKIKSKVSAAIVQHIIILWETLFSVQVLYSFPRYQSIFISQYNLSTVPVAWKNNYHTYFFLIYHIIRSLCDKKSSYIFYTQKHCWPMDDAKLAYIMYIVFISHIIWKVIHSFFRPSIHPSLLSYFLIFFFKIYLNKPLHQMRQKY